MRSIQSNPRSNAWYRRPWCSPRGGRMKRLAIIGVSVSDTNPDTRIATAMVTANSSNKRPRMPPMNRNGTNTATREMVIERMVKPISPAPSSAAWKGDFPISMWRTTFSSMTMASSTTKPTLSVSAISERLSSVYPSRYITANVPTIASGMARLGMSVAESFLRNRKITMTTSARVASSVYCTSATDSFTDSERSKSTCRRTAPGTS